jgi:hypothetical protein
MQHIRQRTLWTQQWLSGVPETGTPPKEPEDPSDDTQALTTETETEFVLVSNNENENGATRNDNFGVLSIPDSGESQRKDLPPSPPSHCPSCGWPWPPPPPSTPSEPIPPQQPTRNLEFAGRGDHSHVFSDLRSPSLARQRDRSAREKYYGFRYVKRGELGSEAVVEGTCSCTCCGVEEEEEEVEEYDDDDDDDKKKSEGSTRSCSTERPPPHPTTATADTLPPPPPNTEEIDKHTLYRLAQLYPRPPKNHHRHIDKVIAPLSQRVDRRREERKHQKAILRDELEDS